MSSRSSPASSEIRSLGRAETEFDSRYWEQLHRQTGKPLLVLGGFAPLGSAIELLDHCTNRTPARSD